MCTAVLGAPEVVGAVLAFAGFTMVAFTADAATGAFVARYARAIAAAVLSTIAFGSLLLTPFSEQYARESVPRRLWSTPQFKQINRQLTTMWALVFAAMIPAHVIAGDRHAPRQSDLQLGDPNRARRLGRQAHHSHQQHRPSTNMNANGPPQRPVPRPPGAGRRMLAAHPVARNGQPRR